MKLVIQSNLYRYLGILLEAREFFEESLCGNKNGRHVDESTSSGKCFFFFYLDTKLITRPVSV